MAQFAGPLRGVVRGFGRTGKRGELVVELDAGLLPGADVDPQAIAGVHRGSESVDDVVDEHEVAGLGQV